MADDPRRRDAARGGVDRDAEPIGTSTSQGVGVALIMNAGDRGYALGARPGGRPGEGRTAVRPYDPCRTIERCVSPLLVRR
jgi:hypothetical protein